MAYAGSTNVKTIGRFEIVADDDHIVGTGATGIVYSGIDPSNDDNPVAAKKIMIEKEFLEEGGYEKEAELLLYTIPPHENIIKIHEFTKREYMRGRTAMVDLWMVMDLCEHDSMNVFTKTQSLSEHQKLEIMYQSALAVEHLHKYDVTHRDIKPQNILLTGDENAPVVKLADFGAARIVERVGGRSLTLHSLAGTEDYMAPEQLNPKKGIFNYDRSVDIFSLGLFLLALLESYKGSSMSVFTVDNASLGRAMWSMQQRYGSTWSGFTPNIAKPSDSFLATAIKQIIKRMIQSEPCDRITISEVVQRLAALRSDVTYATRDGAKQKSGTTRTQHEVRARVDRTKPKHFGHAAKPKESQKEAKPKQSPVAAIKPTGRAGDDDGTRPKQRTGQLGAARPKESRDGPRPKQVTGAAAKPCRRDDDGTRPRGKTKGSRSGGAKSLQLELVDSCDIPFETDVIPAFSSNGSILLENPSDPHLYLYELRAGKYSVVWKKANSSHMRYCCKAVHRTGEILLQKTEGTDTIQYSRHLQPQKIFQRKGVLRGCTDDGHVLYGRGTEDKRDWTIDVWNEQKCVMTLRRPSTEGLVSGSQKRDGWGQYLSACTVGDNLVVVEYQSACLDIFTKQGKHVRHCHLGYKPEFPCAVTAFGTKHVIIPESRTDILHVHSLDGREVGWLVLELGMWNGDQVLGVCYSTDGVLHVATGSNTTPLCITSLRAYKIVKMPRADQDHTRL